MVNLPQGKDILEQINYVKSKAKSGEFNCSRELLNILNILSISNSNNVFKNVRIMKRHNPEEYQEYLEFLKNEKKSNINKKIEA